MKMFLLFSDIICLSRLFDLLEPISCLWNLQRLGLHKQLGNSETSVIQLWELSFLLFYPYKMVSRNVGGFQKASSARYTEVKRSKLFFFIWTRSSKERYS